LEIESKNSLVGTGGIQIEVFKKNFATLYFNVARYNNQLSALITQNNTIYGYALSWGYNSFVGPIEFIVSKGYVLNLCCLIFFAGMYALFDCKA